MIKTKFIHLVFTMLAIAGCATTPTTASQAPTSPPATWTPAPTVPPLSADALENLFGNSSCSWPCWQGITPGITTSTEALQKLQDSPLIIKKYSIQSEGAMTESGEAHWRWKIGDELPEIKGDIEWRNGIVLSIELTTHIVSIEDIIARFGSPEKIGVIDCTEIPEGPRWFCATLYYRKIGFDVRIDWVGSWDTSEIQITPSDPINFVELSIPSWNDNWLSFKDRNYQDWKGYGSLDLYIQ